MEGWLRYSRHFKWSKSICYSSGIEMEGYGTIFGQHIQENFPWLRNTYYIICPTTIRFAISYRFPSYKGITRCPSRMDTESEYLSITQDLVFYAESRFRRIILSLDKLQKASEWEARKEWIEYCLRKELVSNLLIERFNISNTFWNQHFILLFIGHASALRLTINIPIIISTLAAYQFNPSTVNLSCNLGSILTKTLEAILDNHTPTSLVATYSFNWWDRSKVRRIIYSVCNAIVLILYF